MYVYVEQVRKGDNYEEFYNRGSLLALLFHELSHMKAMNHGENFLKTLKGIYEFATDKGLFLPGCTDTDWICHVQSPWEWERELYRTGGKADLEALLKIHRDEEVLRQKLRKEAEERKAKEEAAGGEKTSKPSGIYFYTH